MWKIVVIVLVLAAAVAVLGERRGWFSVMHDNNVDVQVDREKFKQDKQAFSKIVDEKTKSMKAKVEGLWKKSEGLTGVSKVRAEKELGELKVKHERLEHQIKELDDAGMDRFESIKEDLTKSLEDVEKKIEESTKKLEKDQEK